VVIVDLEPGDPRLETDVLPVLAELRPHLTPQSLAAVYAEGHAQGLRFSAAYDEGRCVGVAGWRVVSSTSAIRTLYVDDLVTTAAQRSKGVGLALLSDLSERAEAQGCRVLALDSGTQRVDAHRFYLRERMAITAFHFTRAVT
jgi:GNAT superfamily N-acetyltransferase